MPHDIISVMLVFSYDTSLSGESVTPISTIQISTIYACIQVIEADKIPDLF